MRAAAHKKPSVRPGAASLPPVRKSRPLQSVGVGCLRVGPAIHMRLPARDPSPFPLPQGEGKKKSAAA